jgi:F-type H+-transporting ATPase subunit gamma
VQKVKEKELFNKIPFFILAFYDNLEVEKTEGPQKHLFIAATSDRGLCGAANSSIIKNIRTQLTEEKQKFEGAKVIAIGDKSRAGLARTHSANLLLSVNEIGKRSIVFGDASAIAQQLLNSGFEFDSADIVYNKFK